MLKSKTANCTPADPVPELAYAVTATWNGGYNGSLKITNSTSTTMKPWSIIVEAEGLDIRNSWGMTATDLGDGTILLEGSGYGEKLSPGRSVTVGFTGKGQPPADLVIVSETAPETGWAESPFDGGDYETALDLSMDFYYAQYSGDLPDDHPIAWRGDSALDDGADVGRDLSGGFYDAGDHVKFGLPQAYTATVLAWGALDYKKGYVAAGSYNDVTAHVEWVSDYLLRAYDDKGTADLSDDVFYGQVGNGRIDHAWWGPAEQMTMERPAYAITAENPGTEVTAQTAAGLASSAMVLLENGDVAGAATMIDAAESLFAFSEAYRGTYTDAIPDAEAFYGSYSGYMDELAWAATWLFEATGKASYLQKAKEYYTPSGQYWAMNWDDQSMGTAVRLAEFTGEQRYFDDLDIHFSQWIYAVDRTPGTDTNGGLGWIDEWGSNRYAANTAFLALQYGDVLKARGEGDRAADLNDFARDQIDYMLGDNPDSFSYVVGFGESSPASPHHRGASGTLHVGTTGPNLNRLDGALVGGPGRDGSYRDDRTDYVGNEVAIDYNAGFSGALAGILSEDQFLFT